MGLHFGLIGRSLQHSFSQQYFTEFFKEHGLDHRYSLFEVEDVSGLKDIIKSENLSGLNVTIPFKEDVIPLLDEVDPIAADIGAINCIKVKDDGSLKGFNTDHIGFRKSLALRLRSATEVGTERSRSAEAQATEADTERSRSAGAVGSSPPGKGEWPKAEGVKNAAGPSRASGLIKALILGSGGASKAIKHSLNQLDVPFQTVSRDSPTLNYQLLTPHLITEHRLIINCTPLGTFPKVDEAPPIPYSALTSEHILYDLVYNPAETLFMKRGLEKGATVCNGLEMLRIQAEESWRIWTGAGHPE